MKDAMPNSPSPMEQLAEDKLTAALSNLPGWEVQGSQGTRGSALYKVFKFRTFVEAFTFMTAVAFHAEKMNHHPDWSNVYNKVSVKLTTHDAHGITENDIALAHIMETHFQSLK